jgi:tetratricopeptide (TPR) repeat protein
MTMPSLAVQHALRLLRAGDIAGAEGALTAITDPSPDVLDARYELGSAFQGRGQWEAAERVYRTLMELAPSHVAAKLGLGSVLIETMRPVEAEAVLRRGLQQKVSPRLQAALHMTLGLALRRQRKDTEALAQYDTARTLDPSLPELDIHRAEALQNLKRYDEALETYRQNLAREPHNPQVHRFYNELLHRLERTQDYLKSYDRVAGDRALLLGKAAFLSHDKRDAECYAIHRGLLARDPDDMVAAAGSADALVQLGRPAEALAVFELLLSRGAANAYLFNRAAEAALRTGDPQKALAHCEQGLALAPRDPSLLASMSVALRMMDDERDDVLNGYDSLIQAFDLEPPDGFATMADFNAALAASLDRLHPQTREYVGQSLRGGTQTPDHLFGAGHDLVDRLQVRIAQTLSRYIAGLKEDETHPFLSRRMRGFRYAGSWSSRLKDCGFHVNHVHPQGWISSCYYVAVPDAVKDETARQGWIKFGEPGYAVALKNPIRRALQPVPGRLVLFPSYMWHGTIPFRDQAARTTIAFDAIPAP